METIQQETNYDYPMVIETGETFISDSQVIRFIGEKCGDEMGRFIEKKLDEAKVQGNLKNEIKRALNRLWDICLSDVEDQLTNAIDILETAGGLKG